MAVTTAATSQILFLHHAYHPPTPHVVVPAAHLVHDAQSAAFHVSHHHRQPA
jgi:hypothetical protein